MNLADLLSCFQEKWELLFSQSRTISSISYQIGSQIVNLHFSHQRLKERLEPAQVHLMIKNKHHEPDLSIYLWDLATHQQELPYVLKEWFKKAASQPQNYLGPNGELQGGHTKELIISFNPGNGTFYIYNKIQNNAWVIFKNIELIPYYDIGAPVRVIWHWFAQEHNNLLIHAGAIGTVEKGILLVGKGGSGKSTSTLACVNHPKLRYLGDDYCIVSPEPKIVIYSLFNSVKLVGSADLKRFPYLENHLTNLDKIGEEKALAFVNHFAPESIQNSVSMRAIGVPKITGLPETTWFRIPASKALLALAPSSLFQLPYSSPKKFKILSQIINKIPCYQINLGTDISKIPNTILEILEVC